MAEEPRQPVSAAPQEYQQQQTALSNQVIALLDTSDVGTVVNMAELIDTPWDRMCVYAEGESGSIINADIGSTWDDPDSRVLNQQYVVFVDSASVTMDFPLSSPVLAIDTEDGVHCISRSQAMFKVQGIDTAAGGMRKFYARIK